MSTRECNALEQLYAKENVRFAVLFSLPVRSVEAVEEALRSGVGSHSMAKIQLLPPSSMTLRRETIVLHRREVSSSDMAAVLTDEINRFVPPEALELVVLIEDGASWGFMINTCHGTCDGRSIMASVNIVASLLEGAIARSSLSFDPLPQVPPDWCSLLQGGSEPLPFSNTPISLEELHWSGSSPSPRGELRIDIEKNVLDQVLPHLKEIKATLTGFIAACLIQAVGESWLSSRPAESQCFVSVNLNVDLRGSIRKDYKGAIPQAIGTVTIGHQVTKVNSLPLKTTLAAMATEITKDMNTRVQRGEAVHAAMLMAKEGWFSDSLPKGTFNLSSWGIVDIAPGYQMMSAQRSNSSTGASIVAQTEGGSGVLRLALAADPNLKAPMSHCMRRAIELLCQQGDKAHLPSEIGSKSILGTSPDRNQLNQSSAWVSKL